MEDLASRFLPQPDDAAGRDLLIALGRAMMAWNTAEGCLRVLLDVLVDEDGGAGQATILALSAEASVAGLEIAVEALARAVLKGDRLADVKFAVDYIAAVRNYRNYYVHGVNHVVSHQGSAFAPVLRWSAKRGIKHNVDRITKADLDNLAVWSANGAAYIMALPSWWYPVNIPGETPTRPARPIAPPPLLKTTNDILYYRQKRRLAEGG